MNHPYLIIAALAIGAINTVCAALFYWQAKRAPIKRDDHGPDTWGI